MSSTAPTIPQLREIFEQACRDKGLPAKYASTAMAQYHQAPGGHDEKLACAAGLLAILGAAQAADPE